MSLEKLAEASDGSRKTERLQRRWSGERKPPPKPPHTYYNKHRYPDEEEEPRSSGESSHWQCWGDVLACIQEILSACSRPPALDSELVLRNNLEED